jgi:hypothetical protein
LHSLRVYLCLLGYLLLGTWYHLLLRQMALGTCLRPLHRLRLYLLQLQHLLLIERLLLH